MRSFLWIFLAVLSVAPACLTGRQACFAADANMSAAASEPQQMQDFNLAGYGTRGEKTWEVQGARMDMEGNDVKISDIKARLYGDKEDMVLTADTGRFDRATGIVYLKDNVRAVTESGARMTTDSLNWAQDTQLITTKDQVNVFKDNMTAQARGLSAQPDLKIANFEKEVMLTLEDRKQAPENPAGESGAGPGQMVITCDGPMELNYEKNTAVFEKNVKVEGDAEQGTMISDRMTVYFNPQAKQIERIEAEGHVKIVRGENTSYSDGAIFTAQDKKLLLTGRPKLVFFTPEEGADVSP